MFKGIDASTLGSPGGGVGYSAGACALSLAPNIQLVYVASATLITIYPEKGGGTDRPLKLVSISPELAAHARARDAELIQPRFYDQAHRESDRQASLQASLEVFASTIEQEDYVMGAMQQRAAESGQLQSLLFGRRPALHPSIKITGRPLKPPLVPESAAFYLAPLALPIANRSGFAVDVVQGDEVHHPLVGGVGKMLLSHRPLRTRCRGGVVI